MNRVTVERQVRNVRCNGAHHTDRASLVACAKGCGRMVFQRTDGKVFNADQAAKDGGFGYVCWNAQHTCGGAAGVAARIEQNKADWTAYNTATEALRSELNDAIAAGDMVKVSDVAGRMAELAAPAEKLF